MDINDILYRLLAGGFSKNDKQELEKWLQKSEVNRQHYEELMNGEDLVDSYHVFHKIDKKAAWYRFIKGKKPGRRFFHSPYLRVAAVILLFLTAGVAYWYSQYTKVTPPEISESVQLAMQQSKECDKQYAEVVELSEELRVKSEEWGRVSADKTVQNARKDDSSLITLHSSLTKDQLLSARRITTKHDKEFWLTLDDGTLVHLNYNTRLIYPETFGRGNRNVILDGEAYFMVAKDRSRPFVVHTPEGDIKVYGTEFNVNTNEATTIVLVKGSVSVTHQGGVEQMLQPNECCRMTGTSITIEDVDVEPYVAWHTGTFAFINSTIENIVKVLSQWYNVEIILKDETIKKERFSGYLDRYLSQDQVFDAISKSSNLKIYRKDEKVYVQR